MALGTVLNGMFWTTELPVRRTMLGEIAGPPLLSRAMALESATSNATRMVGPALGGVLLDRRAVRRLSGSARSSMPWHAPGRALVYREARPAAATGGSLLAMLVEGWRFARAQRLILGALAVTVIVNLWGFAYITMVPVIGERVLDLSPALIGVLMSTEGFGALVGAFLVGRTDRPRRYAQIYTGSSLLFLLAVLAFALSAWPPLSFALILLSRRRHRGLLGDAEHDLVPRRARRSALAADGPAHRRDRRRPDRHAPRRPARRLAGCRPCGRADRARGPAGARHWRRWSGRSCAGRSTLLPGAAQPPAGATSSRTAIPSSSGDGAG